MSEHVRDSLKVMVNEAVVPDFGIAATSEAEQRLLDFVASLILDLAHTNSWTTQKDVALWVARVVVGS